MDTRAARACLNGEDTEQTVCMK